MKKKILLELVSAVLILLFMYASLRQWLGFAEFRDNVNNQPFSNSFTPWITALLPAVEFLIALGLIFERTRRKSFVAAFSLLLCFSIYIVLILTKSFAYIPCSCSGIFKGFNWTQQLWFNLFFLGLAVVGYWLGKSRDHYTASTPQAMPS